MELSKDRYRFVTAWLSGSIWELRQQITSLLPYCLPQLSGPYWFNLLGFGEEQAISLGLSLTWFLVIAVGLAASTVGYTGNLAFVGLLAPHIAKGLIGRESRSAFFLAGMIGSLLVLVSDTIGRLLLTSGEIPAGIIISIVAPYFVFLLIRRKEE